MFEPNSEVVSREEFLAQKRFYSEQYKAIGVKVAMLQTLLYDIKPDAGVHPKIKEVLSKQVERLTKEVQSLHVRISKIEKQLGINIQGQGK